MIEIAISEEDRIQLRQLQLTHPHHVIRRRSLILLLKQQAIPHNKIAQIAGVCENTVRAALIAYQNGGIDLLTTISFRKPCSKLKPFDTEIIKYFSLRVAKKTG